MDHDMLDDDSNRAGWGIGFDIGPMLQSGLLATGACGGIEVAPCERTPVIA